MDRVTQDEERVISRRRRSVFIFAAIVLSTLTVLLLFEIILRVHAYWDDRKNFEAFQKIGQVNIPPDHRGGIMWPHCIRASENPKIIYELIPNLSLKLKGRRFSTNSEGFRGPPSSVAKNTNTFRIIGIGDSVMFGWGVHDDETYLSLLNNKLNAEFPDISWEVINTAVPGYNTVMEVETLKEKGIKYRPDLVIVGFTHNDVGLPNFIRAKRNYFAFGESYLIGVLEGRMKKSTLKEDVKNILIPAPRRRVPQEYRSMVGVDAYIRAMRDLKSLSVMHGFPILFFSIWPLPEYAKEITSELHIPTINASQAIRAYMLQNKIPKYYGRSVMVINEKDSHPSALTHEIMMNVLFDYIEGNLLSNHPSSSEAAGDS